MEHLGHVLVSKSLDVRRHMETDDAVVTRPGDAVALVGGRSINVLDLVPSAHGSGKGTEHLHSERFRVAGRLLEKKVVDAGDDAEAVADGVTLVERPQAGDGLHGAGAFEDAITPDVVVRSCRLLTIHWRTALIAST